MLPCVCVRVRCRCVRASYRVFRLIARVDLACCCNLGAAGGEEAAAPRQLKGVAHIERGHGGKRGKRKSERERKKGGRRKRRVGSGGGRSACGCSRQQQREKGGRERQSERENKRGSICVWRPNGRASVCSERERRTPKSIGAAGKSLETVPQPQHQGAAWSRGPEESSAGGRGKGGRKAPTLATTAEPSLLYFGPHLCTFL